MALFGKPSARDEQKAEQYRLWMSQRDPFAIASLVLGIFSLIEFGALLVFGIAGIVLGVLALRRLKSPGAERPLGHRLAWAGIVTSALSLVLAFVIYLHPWR